MSSGVKEQRNGNKISDLSFVESNTETKDNEMIDWLGRPITGRKLCGWRSNLSFLGALTCGYFAYGGIYSNLVLYLIKVYEESSAGAANVLTNLLGTMFFTSLVGAFLGDAYWGRLWTVVVFLIIYVVGCVLVSIAVTIQEGSYPINPPSGLRTFLSISLYITALGNGSYEPVLASLAGDQFDTAKEKGTCFNWIFVFCTSGQCLSLVFLTYLENNGNWTLGFWISTGAVVIAVPLFLFGAPEYRQHRPGGNPFLRIAQVLVSAFRKLKVKVSMDTQSLYEIPGEVSAISGTRKIRHSGKFRWLDKAATITGDDVVDAKRLSDPWRLCTVTQVEEVKCLVNILPVLITGILFNAIVAQMTTLFIEQGATMDPHLGLHFKMPPGTMQVFTFVTAIVFAPIYDRYLVPWLKKRTGHPKGLPTLQRMGWGFVVSILAMIVAAVVEMKRLKAAKVHKLLDSPGTAVPVSIFWLIPQFAIVGFSLVFVIVAQMDFFYTEVSDGMRSIGISLPLVCRGLGNYASSVLVTVVTTISEGGGKKLGWIPRNLNRGHVDYFYWLLATLMLLTLMFHLICAQFHSYIEIQQHVDEASDGRDGEMLRAAAN